MEKLMSVIDRMTGSVAISMTYGVDVRPINDPNLQVARLANQAIVECITTGSTSVDLFPPLKYLPSWVPGASFHEKAKVSRQYAERLREGIFSDGRNKMVISFFRYLYPMKEPNHPRLYSRLTTESNMIHFYH
jgi:hypothetical protein